MQKDMQGNNRNSGQLPLEHWLTLEQVPRFGIAKLQRMLSRHRIKAEEIFAADSSTLSHFGFNPSQIQVIHSPNQRYIERSIAWQLGAPDRFILPFGHPAYPSLLGEIAVPPMLLYGCGDTNLLCMAQIAIVGSRNPSPSGKENTKYFANSLSNCGWTITSGLALGVDGLAHQGALFGRGLTVAVLGTGIDYIYPRRHVRLAEKILENGGTLISEFAPNTPIRPENFPRRNRIISGLSLGTLIVEAAIKSGSLITARFAIEQDREVFAVPGNIHNPLSKGCHYLLKQGAKLVEDVGDINEEFQNFNIWKEYRIENKTQKNVNQDLASDLLLDSVDFEATPIDIVAERSGIPVSLVMSQLLEYELRGLVTAVPGGYLKLGAK
jgi:DNA processing protein